LSNIKHAQGSADSVPKPCKLALGSEGGIVIIFRGDDLPPLWGKEMEREWRLAPGVRKRRWGLVLYNSSETSGSKNSFPDTSPSHADGNCKRSRISHTRAVVRCCSVVRCQVFAATFINPHFHGLNPRSKNDADHAWDTWRTPAGREGRL
jgi:hypothetical protein